MANNIDEANKANSVDDNDPPDTINLIRVGEEADGPQHMFELTTLELTQLLEDCQDELERRRVGASA